MVETTDKCSGQYIHALNKWMVFVLSHIYIYIIILSCNCLRQWWSKIVHSVGGEGLLWMEHIPKVPLKNPNLLKSMPFSSSSSLYPNYFDTGRYMNYISHFGSIIANYVALKKWKIKMIITHCNDTKRKKKSWLFDCRIH